MNSHGKQQNETSIPADVVARRERISGAVQDPFTVIPLFIAVLLLLTAKTFGSYGFPLYVAAAISFAVAATSFIWRYLFRYAQVYAERLQDLKYQEELARKDRATQTQFSTQETLRTGFTSVGSQEGLRELNRMAMEFDQLQGAVARWPESSVVSIGHIPALAEETYVEGLNVLSSVLELLISIEASDKSGLENDLLVMESELQTLLKDGTQPIRIELRTARLADLRERLGLLSRQEIRAEEFLLKSSLIEGALNRTRIELTSLRVDSSQGSVSAVSEELQKTIDQAREVLDEMRQLGF